MEFCSIGARGGIVLKLYHYEAKQGVFAQPDLVLGGIDKHTLHYWTYYELISAEIAASECYRKKPCVIVTYGFFLCSTYWM